MEEINYKVRVLIVEDEPLIAENLAMYLNNNDYEVAGIAYDFEEGMLSLKEGKPDIVLLDINLEGKQDGIDLGKYIHEKLGIPFVFLSSYSDKNTLDRAKQVQPSGYLVKPFHEKTLLTTLEISLANFAGFSNPKNVDLNLDAINSFLHSPLSQREFEVLQLIYGGKTNQQISQELYISINTLKRHINNAYMRLDVNTRTTAIKKLRDLMKLK
ncbi:MAG: response regulator transcription factor [Saprospiraceae bacterium]|nr:response regulator transcription factor [Candidatus Vicinibacter affinis]MBK7695644.1 response regulator transcription factor [Candidatus Vicinibacter affinis]MBK9642857.1 response regulator transcription factor [Candidatus Vicinibacter affinis]